MTAPAPSLSRKSTFERSGRFSVIHLAPRTPPVSSSATLMTFSVPLNFAPLRARCAAATASAAVWLFMSIAPRPYR